MSTAIKAGVLGTAAAAGTTGTYFLVWGVDYMPEYALLNENTTNKSSYSSKLGGDYEYFLVDPDTSKEKNKLWWGWSYRRWLEDSKKSDQGTNFFSTDFQKIKRDDSDTTDGAKTIDKACDEVYKKASTDVDFGKGSENQHKLGRDLLKYCSPLGGAPETIRDSDQYESGKLAKDKKSELISTYGNDLFWSLKTDWFNGQTTKPTGDKFFEPFLDSNNSNKLKQPLREVCDKAYRAQETINGSSGEVTETKPKESEIVKYCSFKKTS